MTASENLSKLSDRAKEAQQHASAAARQKKAELQNSVDEARDTAQAEATKLRENAKASKGQVSAWWDEQQQAWNDHISKIRKDIDAKKQEHDAKKAEKRAQDAETDAQFAVDYAYAAIVEAEYLVLDATLARLDAEDMSTSGGGRPT